MKSEKQVKQLLLEEQIAQLIGQLMHLLLSRK
jgi:hypothetical protein